MLPFFQKLAFIRYAVAVQMQITLSSSLPTQAHILSASAVLNSKDNSNLSITRAMERLFLLVQCSRE